MDKTGDIDKILSKMVEQIKKEDDEILEKIKNELHNHEIDIKTKIIKYSHKVENTLFDQRKQVPRLVKEIESLVGTGRDKQGRLSNMTNMIETFRKKHQYEIDYLETNHIPDIRKIHEIGQLRPWPEDKREIEQIESALNQILSGLKGYQIAIGKILGEQIGYEEGKQTYKAKIEKQEHMMENLGVIEMQNDIYLESLEYASNGFFKRADLKRLVEPQKGNFIDEFLDDVEVATSVTYKELRYIHREIKKELEQANKIRKRLNNTKFLLEYLDDFSKQKKNLDEINLVGNGLSKINQLIKSVNEFITKYQMSVNAIIASSSILFTKFENRHYHSGIQGGRSAYIPKTMSLDKVPLIKLKNHIKKLTAIQEFNNILNQIKQGMGSLNGNSKQSNGSDVKKALEWLVKIYGTLTKVYSSINPSVTKMEQIYKGNQDKINGITPGNGDKIQEHVASIGHIPSKIAELHSQVKYNKVLLNIAKSVNETMNKVKDDAGNLRYIEARFSYINKDIKEMIQRYTYANSNIVGMSADVSELSDLNRFMKTIEFLKIDLGRLNNNIKWMKVIKQWLLQSISKIKDYQKILFKISGKIALGFSKIGIHHFGMLGVIFGHPVFGSILYGFHGIELSRIISPLLVLSVRVGFIMAYLSSIWMMLEQIVRSGLIESIEPKVDTIGENIKKVELSIESVIICFLKCSNESIIPTSVQNNIIQKTYYIS